jgi:hypothetical protein
MSLVLADGPGGALTRFRAEYPGIEDFCFPEGALSERLSLSQCNSELLEMTHSFSSTQRPDNLFVFLFTDNSGHVYYGVCVQRRELLHEPPGYITSSLDVPRSDGLAHTTTRCYCLVSKFPFFRLHIDFLLHLACRWNPSLSHSF